MLTPPPPGPHPVTLADLKYLEPDRLLIGFRMTAGIDPGPAESYGGWCRGGGCTWIGHFLSALAFASAAEDDPALTAKGNYIVAALGQAQAGIAQRHPDQAGWHGTGEWTDPPVDTKNAGSLGMYGTHKLLAGLCDQATVAGNAEAKAIAIKVADFLHKALAPLIRARGYGWWSFLFLNPGNAGKGADIGGIYEALLNVYALSGKPAHLELATYFYNWPFFDPLLRKVDTLANEHANAHLPVAVGVARGAELTGNSTLRTIAENFYTILTEVYTFSTGGSSGEDPRHVPWSFPPPSLTPHHLSCYLCVVSGAFDAIDRSVCVLASLITPHHCASCLCAGLPNNSTPLCGVSVCWPPQ